MYYKERKKMKLFNFITYGEEVKGYTERVLNEREARAGAGIMFLLAFISMTNCFMLSDATLMKYYISFFVLDFLLRVTKAKYSPSLILGRFFVQNQDPEYVGAKQKRFSWGLGLLLSTYMYYAIIINFDMSLLTIFFCFVCLTLLFLEAAFSICIGCIFYGLLHNNKLMYCPGNVCKMKFKSSIQKFDNIQKIILIITITIILSFSANYIYNTKTKTHLGNKIKEFFMTDKDKQIRREKEYQKALEEFENEDF